MTDAEIKSAIEQLMQSGRGRSALDGLNEWLASHGFGLDGKNQEAVLTLIVGVWGPRRGTVSGMIDDALVAHVLSLNPREMTGN